MNYDNTLSENNMNIIISYKDCNLSYIDCNEGFLKTTGICKKQHILGLNDFDLVWSKYADDYKKHDVDTLNGNHYTKLVPVKDCYGDELLFLNTKMQAKNEKSEVIGVISHAIQINSESCFRLAYLLNRSNQGQICSSYTIENKLSCRENECLFLLARGKSAKMIAKKLDISPRTAEHYIERLKIKFNCSSKFELIDVAISKGYIQIIPNVFNVDYLIHMLE